jgi:Fe2+ transport system protein FeoA
MTRDPSQPVLLSDLQVGAVARLCDTQVDSASVDLLEALGLTRACRLRLCKSGEPCIVQVRTTRIGLSQSLARRIYVIPDTMAVT